MVYINDLVDGLSSYAKYFADDTSLFSVIHDVETSANELNDDLNRINKWRFQWKMSFNPHASKQAQEIIFSRKTKKISHPSLLFHNSIVSQTPSQKHLGIFLEAQLTFEEHLKVNKTIGMLWKLQKKFTKTGINDYIQSFCETIPRLW